jgi:hypothetical protein
MSDEVQVAASDIPEDRARQLVGFLPARNGVCVSAPIARAIYGADAANLTNFLTHYVAKPLDTDTGRSWRIVTAETGASSSVVISHRIFTAIEERDGQWFLVPKLDADSADADHPFTVSDVAMPYPVQSVQIGDETFLVDGHGLMLRFCVGVLDDHEVARLYPIGMSAPKDFAHPLSPGSGAPYIDVSEHDTDPLGLYTFNMPNSFNGSPNSPSRGWYDQTRFTSNTNTATLLHLDE